MFLALRDLGVAGAQVGRGGPRVLNARGIKGLLLRCSVPTVVKVALASLCGVVSDMFVNRNINTVTVSNLTVSFPLVGLLITFYALIKINNTAVSSVHLKRGSASNTRGILKGMAILYIVGSVFCKNVALLFLSQVLFFFKTDRSALPCTHSFVRVVLVKDPIACMVVKLGGVVHTANCPQGTVLSSVLAIKYGVVLTPIFVF